MRNILIGGVGLLLLAWPCPGQYKTGKQYLEGKLNPHSGITLLEPFNAGDEASVVLRGKTGRSAIGVYIFDEHGNCLTRDDQGIGSSRDDSAVEWVAPVTAPYGIEIRNLGSLPNSFDMAIRWRREAAPGGKKGGGS